MVKSNEIVEIINKYRIENGNLIKKRHKDLLRSIRKIKGVVNQEDLIKSRYTYKSYNGGSKTVACYKLNKNSIKALLDMTKSTDKVPLQEIYESLGGDYSETICIDRFETTFFNKLMEILNVLEIEIELQKPILSYKLDGYIKKYNLAIEYDEEQHFVEPQKSEDKIRQAGIKKELNCKFIRLDYRNTDAHNVGMVIKEIKN